MRSILTLIGAIVVSAWLLGAGITIAALNLMKSSEPYQQALQVALNDARVEAKLGAPVKAGWLPRGKVNTSGDSGYARIYIPLEGSVHKGTVYVSARKTEGQWNYQTLALSVEGESDKMDILAGSRLPSSPGTQQPGMQQPGQQAQKKSSRTRTKPRPVIAGIIFLAVALYIFGIVNLVFLVLRSSVPYKYAVQLATNDARVQSVLGAPVKPGWIVSGAVRNYRRFGFARLAIPLRGSMTKGKLYVAATKSEGDWSYQRLEVKVDGGVETVDLSGANPFPAGNS